MFLKNNLLKILSWTPYSERLTSKIVCVGRAERNFGADDARAWGEEEEESAWQQGPGFTVSHPN